MIDWGFIHAGLTLLLQWSAAKKYLKRGDVPVRYGSCSKAAAAAILNSTSKPGESASRSVAVETARMSKQSSKIWAPVSLVCSILLFVPQYGYLNQLNPNLNKSWTGRPSHIGAAQPGQPRGSRASHRHHGMTFSCFSPSIISASTSFSTETCPRDPWVKSWGAPINHGLVGRVIYIWNHLDVYYPGGWGYWKIFQLILLIDPPLGLLLQMQHLPLAVLQVLRVCCGCGKILALLRLTCRHGQG